VKRETYLFIFLALLSSRSTCVFAQEELEQKDLEALIDEEKKAQSSAEESEVFVPASEETNSSETITSEVNETESKSEVPASETVDLSELDESAIQENNSSQAEPAPEQVPVETVSKPVEEDKPQTGNDDLDSLKKDLGEELPKPSVAAESKTEATPAVFDVGREERELMSLAQNIQGQISNNQWNEVATASKIDTYTVVKDDWLFKISKKLFGTGFYYPKIWSLNSYITNPHFIEPGMILSFSTGSASAAPEVKVGSFTADELNAVPGSIGNNDGADLKNFGEDITPAWIEEKKNLESQGIYFQYASEETMDDLKQAGEQALNREYENYEPPHSDVEVVLPKNYDKSGFDNDSKIFYSIKEGFYLSTFVSTNLVQDFGSLTDGPDENIYFTTMDHAFVQFDDSLNILPGDRFSVYSSSGKAEHSNSDRAGYKYSIVGQIKVLRKIRNKWEVEFTEVSGTPQRGDRITAYTPKIDRITRTFNSRLIEAALLAGYEPMQNSISFGDVVYIDRGRADGLEMGNVLEVYGFKDRKTNKNITDQPTYKLGELTVITLTDNFATVLVTQSSRDMNIGDIAITKTKEAHLKEEKARKSKVDTQSELSGGKALDELDVELNLDESSDELLKQADKIQLTEDELAELERQEREKSIIKDSEKDLKALERLEGEIEAAEKILNDAKLDEDKLLEGQNIDEIEKGQKNLEQDSLEEIEENLGKRYMDEDLNSKDNPYGLTEFDVEEIDELLGTDKKTKDIPE
jgi:nucleoid-associated protein YgaU